MGELASWCVIACLIHLGKEYEHKNGRSNINICTHILILSFLQCPLIPQVLVSSSPYSSPSVSQHSFYQSKFPDQKPPQYSSLSFLLCLLLCFKFRVSIR